MKGQKINLQTLPANTNARYFMKAKQFAFRFKTAKKKLFKALGKPDDAITDVQESNNNANLSTSLICVGVAIVFAVLEGYNIRMTLVGAFNIPEVLAVLVGCAFAATGLYTGKMLVSNTSWKTDEHTGRKKPTAKFFLGLFLTGLYFYLQYWLASTAIGTGESLDEGSSSISWFVLIIGVIEVVFGAIFFAPAWKGIAVSRLSAKMDRNSRLCDETWYKHLRENNGVSPFEDVPVINEAREHYANGGLKDETNQESDENK